MRGFSLDCSVYRLSPGNSLSHSSSVTGKLMHMICMKIKIFKTMYMKYEINFCFVCVWFLWASAGKGWINHISYFIACYHYWSVCFIIWLGFVDSNIIPLWESLIYLLFVCTLQNVYCFYDHLKIFLYISIKEKDS